MNGCWILSNAFSASNEMVVWFLSLSLFLYWITLMDFHILNHPCMHLWNKTYLVRMDDCFNVFLDLFSENFIEYFCIEFIKEIGLKFSIFVGSFCSLGIRVIVVS